MVLINKNLVPAAALAASILGLAACGADVRHGTIVDMSFSPGYFTHYQSARYGSKCVTRGGYVGTGTQRRYVTSRSCARVVIGYSTVTSYVPPVYALELKDAKGNKGWVDVTRDQYSSVHDGMQW